MNETQVARPAFQSPCLHLCLRDLSFSLVIIAPPHLLFLSTSGDIFSLLTSSFCLPHSYLPVPLVANFQLVSLTLNLTCRSLSRQRISGSQLSPSLQYFGQSLSGGQDLTLDGLVDLAVGAQGQVVLLR